MLTLDKCIFFLEAFGSCTMFKNVVKWVTFTVCFTVFKYGIGCKAEERESECHIIYNHLLK